LAVFPLIFRENSTNARTLRRRSLGSASRWFADRQARDVANTPKEFQMAKKKCGEAATEKCCGMKLQPLGDRVVVRRDEAEAQTAGGLYLPETAKDKPARGVVVSIGDGRVLENGERSQFTVKEGDRVLFLSYAGEDFKFGEDEFLLMRESDILAIIS
jgi:chaperonin GroES